MNSNTDLDVPMIYVDGGEVTVLPHTIYMTFKASCPTGEERPVIVLSAAPSFLRAVHSMLGAAIKSMDDENSPSQ